MMRFELIAIVLLLAIAATLAFGQSLPNILPASALEQFSRFLK